MKLELLIIDANVLIDFCKTDRSVLTLVASHVGTLHIPAPVLAEVQNCGAADHGLTGTSRSLNHATSRFLACVLPLPEQLYRRHGRW